jgi:cytochrome c6
MKFISGSVFASLVTLLVQVDHAGAFAPSRPSLALIVAKTTATKGECFGSLNMMPDDNDMNASWNSGVGKVVEGAAAAVLLSIQVALPLPAWSADVAHGATLFTANCAGCHGGGQNFMSDKKTLQKDALEKYLSTDAAKIQEFVQKGMPHKFLPMSKSFSDTDFSDVAAYVSDQALGEKW